MNFCPLIPPPFLSALMSKNRVGLKFFDFKHPTQKNAHIMLFTLLRAHSIDIFIHTIKRYVLVTNHSEMFITLLTLRLKIVSIFTNNIGNFLYLNRKKKYFVYSTAKFDWLEKKQYIFFSNYLT